jgi:Icc protein
VNTLSKRSFLKTTSVASITLAIPSLVRASDVAEGKLRFGLVADVHQDIMHDATARIGSFVKAMNIGNVDFICQLGDFCQPREKNRAFMQQWNGFKGPRYHVIGNHEMDRGFPREQVVKFFGMPSRFYAFDQKGLHFIVLDGNDPGGKSTGYKRFVNEEQLAWLEADLKKTDRPTVVFSHQTLDDDSGIENSAAVRVVLENATHTNGNRKVVSCFCGHHHEDQTKQINGIHYIRINSASYVWLGRNYKHDSYPPEIHQQYRMIANTAPYKDPLWAVIEVDPAKGLLTVTGTKTTWVGPSPSELGVDPVKYDPAVCAPRISDRTLSLKRSA